MKLILAAVASKAAAAKNLPADALTLDYLTRAGRYIPTELQLYPTEAGLLTAANARPAATLILFDSTGDLPTSPEFAQLLGRLRDASTPRIFLAIGPADGWTQAARSAAHSIVSFGRITLPHTLARTVAAEQIYRALTILAHHPYHAGH